MPRTAAIVTLSDELREQHPRQEPRPPNIEPDPHPICIGESRLAKILDLFIGAADLRRQADEIEQGAIHLAKDVLAARKAVAR